MSLDGPIVMSLPKPEVVRSRLADALRDAELLRALLKLSERAARYRQSDHQSRQRRRNSARSSERCA